MRVIAGRAKGHRLAGPAKGAGAPRGACGEKAPRACASIRQNLSRTGFEGQGEVIRAPVERALARLSGPYTLVLADPPYADEAAAALEGLAGRGLGGAGSTTRAPGHSPPEAGT